MTMLSERSKFISDLIDVLGLPKNTVSFSLNARVNEVVTVECEYFPEASSRATVIKKWKLTKEELVDG